MSRRAADRAVVTPNALTALRRATSSAHQRLERRLPPRAITRSPEAYSQVLAAFWGYYAPFEDSLKRARIPLDMRVRSKSPGLRADLMSLGLSVHDVDALPRCGEIPAMRDRAEALGCAYVVEGATLGGQVIVRHVRRELGLAAAGVRFFGGYGSQTGERWRQFLAVLEAEVRCDELARAAHAARATFLSLERWLATRGVLS